MADHHQSKQNKRKDAFAGKNTTLVIAMATACILTWVYWERKEKIATAPAVVPVSTTTVRAGLEPERFLVELFSETIGNLKPTSPELADRINILKQGAHAEGVYNGMIYSPEYRSLEKGVAPPNVVKVYADIVSELLVAQQLDPSVRPKLAQPDVPLRPSEVVADGATTLSNSEKDRSVRRERERVRSEQDGMGRSFYTLKRIAGERVLETIDIKREYREKLATWFGQFVIFLNKKGVSMGDPDREGLDELRYYRWALNATEDEIQWECLFRVHRILNVKMKQSGEFGG